MKILFIDAVHPLLEISLKQKGHQCIDGSTMTMQQLLEHLSSIEGIVIRSRIRIDRQFLESASRLKFIARAGAGMENIDTEAAKELGVVCLNAPEGNRDAVGEHAMAMLLSLLNNLKKADDEVKNGIWKREENRGLELKGKTVALIGYGNTGRSFARKLSGFECQVLACDQYIFGFSSGHVKESSMQEIYENADILSLHVPLTDETEYMVNKSYLQNFKKNIYFINTSRGKCVRTEDLVHMMKIGKVLGACLDVLEYEDLSFEKFDLQHANFRNSDTWKYLIDSERVVLTPHIAGWTFESHERISEVLFRKIEALELHK